MLRTINKVTTYASTISWSKFSFNEMLKSNTDDVIIRVFNRKKQILGSTTVGEVRRNHERSFTKNGSVREIIVAKFQRGSIR